MRTLDPLQPFKLDAKNRRGARESGLSRKTEVADARRVRLWLILLQFAYLRGLRRVTDRLAGYLREV
jgi:hypothetical protein